MLAPLLLQGVAGQIGGDYLRLTSAAGHEQTCVKVQSLGS